MGRQHSHHPGMSTTAGEGQPCASPCSPLACHSLFPRGQVLPAKVRSPRCCPRSSILLWTVTSQPLTLSPTSSPAGTEEQVPLPSPAGCHSPPALLLELGAQQQVGEQKDVAQLAGPLHQLHHETVLQQLPVLRTQARRAQAGPSQSSRADRPSGLPPTSTLHTHGRALRPAGQCTDRG